MSWQNARLPEAMEDAACFTDPDTVPGIRSSVMSMTSPNGHLGFVFSSREVVLPYEMNPFRRALVESFIKKLSLGEIFNAMAAQNPDWDRNRVTDELTYLMERGVLEPDRRLYDNPDTDRYDRQLNFLGTFSPGGRADALVFQKRLEQARVVVIGIGGFGTHILLGLTHMGVGHITAVDHKRVGRSNLNRQVLYDENDVGRRKIAAAESRCRAINSAIDFSFLEREITGAGDLIPLVRGADLVAFTADTPRQDIFSWMNRAAFECRVPVVFTQGIFPGAVRVGPLVVPGKSPCLDCALPPAFLRWDRGPARELNRHYYHGAIEPYLMTASGIMLNEIMAFLTGLRSCALQGAVISLAMDTYAVSVETAASRPGCPLCGGAPA